MTADATAQAREACRAAGMDRVLTKPMDLGDLRSALEQTRVDAPGPALDGTPGAAGTEPGAHRSAAGGGDPAAVALFVSTYLAELPARRLRVQASLRRSDARTALAAACAALGAALHTRSVETARVFLPALLLHSQQLQDELAPYTDPAAVSAALTGSP